MARSEKLIGNSLDAEVNLYLDKEWQNFIESAQVILEDIFLVSKVHCHAFEAKAEDATISDELQGVAIKVIPVSGEKCPRCWKYSDAIGKDASHPDVCPRCAEVLKTKA